MVKLLEELVRGQNWTKQLQILIQNPSVDEVSAVMQQKELADKIFGSLTEVISVISSGSEYSGDTFMPGSMQLGSPSSGDRRSVDSGQSFKRSAVKARKGGYRKRKTSDSRIKISSSVVDEYAWRKYGQKEILNATFPRGYFRCTHKFDQGCKANKQVQRIQDEPVQYQITYTGNHTCTQTLKHNVQDLILDSFSEESKPVQFLSNRTRSEIYHSPSFPNSTVEENKELEVQSKYKSEAMLPLDSVPWSDLMPFTRTELSEDFLPGVHLYDSSFDSQAIDMDLFSEYIDFGNHSQST